MAYYSSDRRELLQYLPKDLGDVLELGCAEGRHGRLLLDKKLAKSVVGVDLHVPSESAVFNLTSFVRADVNQFIFSTDLQFDTCLAHDILEHLEDPWSTVRGIFNILKPGGLLIASIPNLRYVEVSAALIFKGSFEYQRSGILDRTHLRFFTRTSIRELFRSGGFPEPKIERLRSPIQRKSMKMLSIFLRDLGCKQFVALAGRPH